MDPDLLWKISVTCFLIGNACFSIGVVQKLQSILKKLEKIEERSR